MRAAPRGEENSALGFQLLISAAAKKKRKNTFHVHTEELNKLARKVCELTLETGMEMFYIDIDISMEIQFGERVGHGGWLIGPKLFRPEAYPACASSKLCEFIKLCVEEIPWGLAVKRVIGMRRTVQILHSIVHTNSDPPHTHPPLLPGISIWFIHF